MEHKLTISPSPHVFTGRSTRGIMGDVLIALAPALVVSAWVFGAQVLAVTVLSVACCVVFEWLIQKFLIKGPATVGNLSAVVTGVLLAFNLPSSIPLWLVILGAFIAVGVGKMTFGGLGKNPFNPALVGRVFLLIAYPVQMTSFPTATAAGAGMLDAATGATPLSLAKGILKGGGSVADVMTQMGISDLGLAIGQHSGSLGEVAAIALILGGLYLLARRVITWHIPVAVLGTMAVFSAILWGANPESYMSPLFHLLTGGALLGAFFMATDYSTSPMTRKGGIIFGVGIGLITIIIRLWGAYPEGMSFAILIMNAVVPLIDKYVKPQRFGVANRASSAASAKK
ncbi:MAG: RnfABCDGE type electron transport complex subunit D [Alistipes sp.]|jgi:electron transport complex protein RnfD|nr:RnfABCDGE type electron transport complex subunit D [Alistipes sp.]